MVRCDRCGEQEQYELGRTVDVRVYDLAIDLCAQCTKQLLDFLKLTEKQRARIAGRG